MKWPRLPQLQPRERLLAMGGMVVLLVVVLDRLVISPWARHAHSVRQEIQRMEESLQSSQRLLVRKASVLAELQQSQRYLRAPIADELQMATLLKEIEELAGQSQVHLAEIKSLGVETDEVEKRYALEIRFESSLAQWVDFVYRLETAPSLYEVARAGLSVAAETPDRLTGYLRVTSVMLRADHASASGS